MRLREQRQQITGGGLSDTSEHHADPRGSFTTRREQAAAIQSRGNCWENGAEIPNRAQRRSLQEADERTGNERNA